MSLSLAASLRIFRFLPGIVIACTLGSCHFFSHPLLNKLTADHTGIHFSNTITENDSINPIDLEFLYNGGGVAVGDFNKDGLPDLYFTGSMVPNKLYLNKGSLKFQDVTTESNTAGEGEWFNGASVVDINNDGLPDIYLSASIKSNPAHRRNLLYINQGLDSNKVPVFKEEAAEYGLADTSYSVQAAFFDYDNDGDLDMYLVTTKLAKRDAATFVNRDTSNLDFDKLYRNDWNDSLKHPVFTDVSAQAGIHHKGMGLGVAISDINKDGWKDIYVTNDFYGSDLLYINNGNGTFTEKAKDYLKHTSQNAMGNDVSDINNDGLVDIVAVDMNPEDNFRKKKNLNGNNYNIYRNMLYENLMLQYVRNTLQLNMGPRVNANDSVGDPVFGDISFYAGVAQTDWSWNPSLADFDNDGHRDLIITNGYPKDVTDHDFVAFRNRLSNFATKEQLIAQIPQIKVPNYAFRNAANLTFEDVTRQWGLDQPSFSNGAVYVDLDNDGDLDYVINNINEEASVYENTTNEPGKIRADFLKVKFRGSEHNPDGIGTVAEIYYGQGQLQYYENSPYKGYLSTIENSAFFGLGKTALIDSVVIRWPNHMRQTLYKVASDQTLTVDIKNATIPDPWSRPVKAANPLFTDITGNSDIHYVHQETDFVDFNIQRLLPHKLSQYGPGLASGDLNGDGLDDLVVGGTGNNLTQILLQQKDGTFIQKPLPWPDDRVTKQPECMGLLLFDADRDGDLDLYVASGSAEFPPDSPNYQDILYLNDGKGSFTEATGALPANVTSKSCVRAVDIDQDGDLDLFIAGRVLPGSYPAPVSSFIYRNDSQNGVVKFTDVTDQVAKGLNKVGLVCDALWTDFDNDGWPDLVLAGEWMPVTFFKNNKGVLENVTGQSGIQDKTGWWSSIAAGDFDNDGDIDYVVGNLGENSFYRASDQYPVSIYAKDFDKNGSFDAIPTVYLKDKQGGKKREFTAQNRDDIVDQLPVLKKKFLTYRDFATAEFSQVFSKEELKGALILHANYFKSALLRNDGKGHFDLVPLPVMAQLSPVYGMIAEDVNQDGNLDVVLCGNDYGTEVTDGRYDAMNGLVLLGDGKGQFTPLSILQSGFFVPGDAKAMVSLRGANSRLLVAASQNRGPLKLFTSNQQGLKFVPLAADDRTLVISLKNGQKRKQEVYQGNTFLSQSANFAVINASVKSIEIVNSRGMKRTVE
ncbi:MAG TPA: VCBS repeat-containing protein [Chitinophagaceae bacterium]|nr:VCBS repeat-containing protein [Chitinophagaceae bacterium]